MISALKKQDDGTIELTITIPQAEVVKARQKVIDGQTQSTTVKGFRKGKAPKKLVEEQLDPAKVKEETLKTLLPTFYIDAVKEHNLRPIINPKIHIAELADDKDWQFTATTAEQPIVDLGEYKKAVRDVTAKSKIVIPGKEQQEPSFDEIIAKLLTAVKVTVPQVLVEEEVERLLSQMLDEVKTLGLSLEQYLASTKKTPQELRDDYAKRATNDITIEFVLQKIAEEEKITVEPKEVDEAIQKAKDDAERANLERNRYLLTSILRQQKTLDFLRKL